jgi:protein ImuB
LSSPSAIVEQGRILLGDEAARWAGVEGGIGVAAARALAPAITLVARDAAREAAAVHTLACWAGSLTPKLSVTPDTLLLEIGGCLRLFGGLEKMLAAAGEGVRAQGFTLSLAVAPTPMGAQWLAWTGTAAHCTDLVSLRRQLGALPIAVLPARAAAALARFGLRTLADARHLPATALTRRIGAEAMGLMARAYGERPDPRADFVFPERFSLPLQLPATVENAGALLFAAHRLTSALAGWLAARQSGVREFTLRLQHRQVGTALVLQFAEPTADGARFERVLRERLDKLVLDAPVEALRLEAANIAACPGRSRALFNDATSGQEGIGPLLERLSARLGEAHVYRLAAHADHRPECATRHVPLFEKAAGEGGAQAGPAAGGRLPRPLWLLDTPEALPEVDGRPYRRGHLKLLAGPERIESGWWDGGERKNGTKIETGREATGDIRRDYFIAQAENAAWLWIYRECRAPGGWFLHGYFS